jgi:hypothetical protein
MIMISRNRGFVNLAACTAIWVVWIVWSAPFVAAQSSWQADWGKTLRAAEADAVMKIDSRTPDQVIQSIEDQGKIVANTLPTLRGC